MHARKAHKRHKVGKFSLAREDKQMKEVDEKANFILSFVFPSYSIITWHTDKGQGEKERIWFNMLTESTQVS